MAVVRLHAAERDRLDALRSYGVSGTERDAALDALVAIAAQICATPMASVTLVEADRQVFKASVGLGSLTQTSRAWSLCSDVVAQASSLVLPDARAHPRYRDNPMVTGQVGLRAYAGVPLIGRDGLPLGALCVMDTQPRTFDRQSLNMLTTLAAQVVVLMDARRSDLGAGMLDAAVPAEAREPSRLRRALDDGELVPHFQPMVDIITGRTYGLEALLRWEHPRLGTLLPSSFLPLIETSALVVPVGRAVLDAAIAEVTSLRRSGLELRGGIAVNVASGQLARPGLAGDVLSALDRHGVGPQELSLEITETTALPDAGLARAELAALADAGVHIVLDDFGVGWSNFSRLLDLPVSAIKLDRSLVGAVTGDDRAAAVVAATVKTAFELGIDVVAEGIETEAVRRHLAGLGCRWAQGWFFGAAVPAADLPGLLRAGSERSGSLVHTGGRRVPERGRRR